MPELVSFIFFFVVAISLLLVRKIRELDRRISYFEEVKKKIITTVKELPFYYQYKGDSCIVDPPSNEEIAQKINQIIKVLEDE